MNIAGNHTVIPAPGRAIVTMDAKYRENEGGIIMPETVRALKAFSGVVESISPETFRRKCRNCGWMQSQCGRCIKCGGKTRELPAPVYDGYSETLKGKRVMVEGNGVHIISGDRCLVSISDISGVIMGNDINLQIDTGTTPRCKFCGPAKSGTTNGTLLVSSSRGYYCPRCKRYESGAKYVDPVVEAQREAARC